MNQVALATTKAAGRGFACVVTLLLAGLIVVAAWQTEGTLAAQRIIVNLVMPIGLAWLGSFFYSWKLWIAGERRGGALAAFLFLVISMLFSPLLNRMLMTWIEFPAAASSPLVLDAPAFRAVVVLGGGTSLGIDGQPQINTDGHRIVMAAQMWNAGKVSAIICTGEDNFSPGAASNDDSMVDRRDRDNPARQGIDILASLGVPRERLFRIQGTHTAAEMQELSKFLARPPSSFPTGGDVALITSAFHMPRALRLAEREGLTLVPIAVSYRNGPSEPLSVSDLVPDVGAGVKFFTVARECLARLVGR